MSDDWQKTVCILCSVNCGVDVKLDGRHITRVRGNREHVASHGLRLREGAAARLLPERQRPADLASAAARRRHLRGNRLGHRHPRGRRGLRAVRDTYGGASIFYYGGGGQGNHLCGSYGASTRRALGSVFSSNALAQEKTGEFWVDHMLFGTGLSGSYQQAEVAVFVGQEPMAVPWLSARPSDPPRHCGRPEPRAHSDRSAPHGNRGDGGLPFAGASRHRRFLPRGDSWGARTRGSDRSRLHSRPHCKIAMNCSRR